MPDKNENLEELPPSNDKYWEHSEIRKIHMREPKACQHRFEMVNGKEAECVKCHAGFFIPPGMRIENGHIYDEERLVV